MIIINQAIKDHIIKAFSFPGGEQHLDIYESIQGGLADGNIIRVTAYLKNSDDIMQLLLVHDAIKRMTLNPSIILTLPYLPYARQDRVCNYGEPLSISVMTTLINSINAKEVMIYDPHSAVATALIENCTVVDQWRLVLNNDLGTQIKKDQLTILAPDSGSLKKINKLCQIYSSNHEAIQPIVTATKIRNPKDGKISDIKIQGSVRMKDIIIIDDICDGGATFIELAKQLRVKQVNSLRLYVTHGIFSKGLEELFNYFDEIYCYYTFLKKDAHYFNKLKILGEFNHDN